MYIKLFNTPLGFLKCTLSSFIQNSHHSSASPPTHRHERFFLQFLYLINITTIYLVLQGKWMKVILMPRILSFPAVTALGHLMDGICFMTWNASLLLFCHSQDSSTMFWPRAEQAYSKCLVKVYQTNELMNLVRKSQFPSRSV